MPAPVLTRLDAPGARAAVLLLHGGQQRSDRPVDGRSASWQLMRWLQRDVAGPARRQGVSVWAVRYAVRGWNHGRPVADARWALEQLRAELGDVPVVLLGHSMGGRVALHAADDPSVVGVVALAPWVVADTPVSTLAGRRLVAAHGRRDRLTSYAATRAYVDRAVGVADSAELVDMGPLGHYLLRGHRQWRDLAAERSLELVGK